VRADGGGALALVAAVVLAAPARAAAVASDVSALERSSRDVATLTSRQAVLAEQAASARAGARWRARAFARLLAGADALEAATRARAIEAGARALARDLDEARGLAAARDALGATRDALEAAARADAPVGAAPAFAPPVPGAVLARFGVAPDHATGVLVGRAGVRLAAAAAANVRAPAAGTVARVVAERGATTIVLDHGAGWTTIVGGLAEAAVAAGEEVAAGQRIGAAAGAIAFEIWRGRRAVDPALLLRPVAPTLATSARLP
jgi:murein DD-endopeptidase MepM/ murein hydrolase activator NlpD